MAICISFLVGPMISAYAEVTSLTTSAILHRPGDKINFSGTTLSTDSSTVTLLIFDPNNNFVTLTSGFTDSNHAFQIIVDTGSADNQPKFFLKGTYNATAFIANKTQGKVVSFDFSPDGSSVVHQTVTPQTTLSNASIYTGSEPVQSPTPANTQPPVNSQPGQSVNDMLQQQYDKAKQLKDFLDAQNSRQKNVALVDGLIVGDKVADLGINKISTASQDNSGISNLGSNFGFNNIIYAVMAFVGVGVVVGVLYFRKRQPRTVPVVTINNEGSVQKMEEPISTETDYDYATMILKNRLAKGEITVDEFRSLRDALNEP
jgi:uncharacterized membrane protein